MVVKEDPRLVLVPVFVCGDPPLGLGSIATYLKTYSGFSNTKIIVQHHEKLMPLLEKEKPDIIGLSAMTMHYSKAVSLAKEIRNNPLLKDPIIILGGIHISTLPESLDDVFDLAVIGEGEETMREYIESYRLHDGKIPLSDLINIKGLAFYSKGKLVVTPPRELITPLDRIPIVDRSFFDDRFFKKSFAETIKPSRLTCMLTSRGCPYKCRFCSTSHFWQTIRFHSVQRIVDEIEYLVKSKKIECISLWDDLFLINKNRLKEIIHEMRKRDLLGRVRFVGMARANLVDDELCQLAKELGMDYFNFGFESGSDRMIKYLKKDSVGIRDNIRAVRICQRYGIDVGAALIMGSPTETEGDMKATIRFLRFMKKYSHARLAWLSTMVPLPGTEMWDIALARGKVSNNMKDWSILSEYALGEPLLIDVPYKTFLKYFKKARNEVRFFEARTWVRRFAASPLRVMIFMFKELKFIQFFTLLRAEGRRQDNIPQYILRKTKTIDNPAKSPIYGPK